MAVATVIATINGQTYGLEYNALTNKYEATITAPLKSSYTYNDGHYYPVTISATDESGNTATVDNHHETLGEQLRLRVKERIAPTVAITYPSTGATIANSQPTITAQLRDNDSGIDLSLLVLRIDGVPIDIIDIIQNETEDGYDISYAVPEVLVDGDHTITIQAVDNDGNRCEEVSSIFTVSKTLPTLDVTSPAEDLITNIQETEVSGTTNNSNLSPVKITVTVNGGDEQEIVVNADGTFNGSITLQEGDNEIIIKATDGSGQSVTVTRHVVLDTKPPVFINVDVVPNPVDSGKTYLISVEVID